MNTDTTAEQLAREYRVRLPSVSGTVSLLEGPVAILTREIAGVVEAAFVAGWEARERAR